MRSAARFDRRVSPPRHVRSRFDFGVRGERRVTGIPFGLIWIGQTWLKRVGLNRFLAVPWTKRFWPGVLLKRLVWGQHRAGQLGRESALRGRAGQGRMEKGEPRYLLRILVEREPSMERGRGGRHGRWRDNRQNKKRPLKPVSVVSEMKGPAIRQSLPPCWIGWWIKQGGGDLGPKEAEASSPTF